MAERHVAKKHQSDVIILTTLDNSADAQLIVDKLDRLPLALAQAGAYLRDTKISVLSYIKYYDSMWKDLIEEQGRYRLHKYGHLSILTTWMAAYKQVASKSVEAAKLLKLWGFLDRDDLWHGLLASVRAFEEDVRIPEWPAVLTESEVKFNQAIGLLTRYSLVNGIGQQEERHAIDEGLHAWSHHLSSGDEERSMLLIVLEIVARAVPSEPETACWRLQIDDSLYLPCSRALTYTAGKYIYVSRGHNRA